MSLRNQDLAELRRLTSSRTQKSTTLTDRQRREYGTISADSDASFRELNRRGLDELEDDQIRTESIDGALNKIKPYRLFFFLCIIPMILSFAFSDLLVDSLNFLELLPMGMECKTTRLDTQGQNVWVPCSKHRIWNGREGDHIVREKGRAVYRKDKDDYYTLRNWVESMDIEWKSSFQIGALGSIAFIGMAIGSILGALLSAKFGRKFIYIGGLILTTSATFVITLDPHYVPGMIALLIYGIGVFPRMTIGYVYALELVPENSTRTLGMLMFVGECFTIIVSNFYLVVGGRNAIFFVWLWLIFSVIPLLVSFLLPESPKYLHSINEHEGAKDSMRTIAKINCQRRVSFSDMTLEIADSQTVVSDENNFTYFGLLDLWKDSLTLKNTLAMAYLWGFYTFGHHCLIFMLKYVPGDKFMNGLLLAIAVTAAPLITRLVQNYLSTKYIYALFSFLGIIFSGLHVVAFEADSVAALVMIIFVAICIDAIGFTNYYVEFEYFNPKIATLAYGICSMTGRTAAILAPLVVEEFSNTMIIFFIMSIIALFSVLLIQKPHADEVRMNMTPEEDVIIPEMDYSNIKMK